MWHRHPHHGEVFAMPEKLLTLPEVSERLRVPVKTLRYWKREGKGPQPRRLGTRLVYRQSEVEDFIASLWDGDAP
jgi:predicted DNA-binding transcriptional regulator AlpA